MRGTSAVLLALFLAAAGPGSLSGTQAAEPKTEPAKAYEVLLKRPSTVGQRFEFEAEASLLQEESFLREGEVFDGSNSTAEVKLKAVGTVLAVDDAGGVTHSEYVVESFFGRLRGEEIRPVATGAVVVAETTEGGSQISLKDGELTQPQSVLLAQVIETATPGAPSDDELFGSQELRAIGESWPVNGPKIAEAFLRGMLVLPLNEIRGSAKVESLGATDGFETLHISGFVEAANVFPADISPEELESSLLKLTFEGDYPLDTAIQALRGTIKTLYEVSIVFDDGSPQEPGEPAGERLSTQQITETTKRFVVRPLPAPKPPGNDAG